MPREIKFRAWDKIEEKMLNPIDIYQFDSRAILPSWPIMQFTGLLDRNGKEIYEGDIVKRKDGNIYNAGIGVVEYVTNNSVGHPINGYWAKCIGEEKAMTIYPKNCEVIGNIYENPELIK